MPDDFTGLTRKPSLPFGTRKRNIFLAAYRQSANISASCRAADISRETYYNTIESDPKFKALVEVADEEATELLEAKAWSKAIREGDNTSLWNLLKARRPGKYRDPVQRYANTDAAGNDKPELTDEERAARVNTVFDAARARRDRPPDG